MLTIFGRSTLFSLSLTLSLSLSFTLFLAHWQKSKWFWKCFECVCNVHWKRYNFIIYLTFGNDENQQRRQLQQKQQCRHRTVCMLASLSRIWLQLASASETSEREQKEEKSCKFRQFECTWSGEWLCAFVCVVYLSAFDTHPNLNLLHLSLRHNDSDDADDDHNSIELLFPGSKRWPSTHSSNPIWRQRFSDEYFRSFSCFLIITIFANFSAACRNLFFFSVCEIDWFFRFSLYWWSLPSLICICYCTLFRCYCYYCCCCANQIENAYLLLFSHRQIALTEGWKKCIARWKSFVFVKMRNAFTENDFHRYKCSPFCIQSK